MVVGVKNSRCRLFLDSAPLWGWGSRALPHDMIGALGERLYKRRIKMNVPFSLLPLSCPSKSRVDLDIFVHRGHGSILMLSWVVGPTMVCSRTTLQGVPTDACSGPTALSSILSASHICPVQPNIGFMIFFFSFSSPLLVHFVFFSLHSLSFSNHADQLFPFISSPLSCLFQKPNRPHFHVMVFCPYMI